MKFVLIRKVLLIDLRMKSGCLISFSWVVLICWLKIIVVSCILLAALISVG